MEIKFMCSLGGWFLQLLISSTPPHKTLSKDIVIGFNGCRNVVVVKHFFQVNFYGARYGGNGHIIGTAFKGAFGAFANFF